MLDATNASPYIDEVQQMRAHVRAGWISVILMLVSMACTDARLQLAPPQAPDPLDNLLEIQGDFCTEPSAQVTFPLKVVYIVDQSTSLQCTDSRGLRFNALNRSIDQLRSRGNTEFAFVGFSSWSRQQAFTRSRDDIAAFLDPAGGLGPATDYQGALATTLRVLEQDMLNADPAELARTRYLINFISDGNPEPRCLPGCEDDEDACADGEDNDGDGQVDGADESCNDIDDFSIKPDSLYGVCNFDGDIPDDVYVDVSGICPEYNQPNQILRRIEDLLALQDLYSVGDVRLNTVLLFSPTEVVEGLCPGASMAFGYDREVATSLLQQMANVGNGTFRDVNLADDDDNFLQFDLTSLKAEQTLVDMSAINEHSLLSPDGLTADSDRDGLSDILEVEINTNRESKDTDGDSFGDMFEYLLRKEGFDPKDPERPALDCPSRRDGDGDGLLDCEESFLKTNPLLPDTDADGVLDRTELLMGTDPLVPDALTDLDFDGVFNADEIKGGTDPLSPDAETYRADRVVYEVDDRGVIDVERLDNGRVEERHCYGFGVRNIQLVPTPLVAERGLNRVLLYTQERPAKVAGVPGEVRVACFESFYNGTTIKSPASGIIDITEANLATQRTDLLAAVDEVFQCSYFTNPSFSRNELVEILNECMPPKVEINRRLYTRDELEDLITRNLDGNTQPTLPRQAFELFYPIQNFNPANHCYRPWEYDLLLDFLRESNRACQACVKP